MKMMLLPAAALLLTTAFAQAKTQVDIDCDKAVTTPELNACAESTFQDADKKLNQAYQKLMKTLSQPDEEGLPYSTVKATCGKGSEHG